MEFRCFLYSYGSNPIQCIQQLRSLFGTENMSLKTAYEAVQSLQSSPAVSLGDVSTELKEAYEKTLPPNVMLRFEPVQPKGPSYEEIAKALVDLCDSVSEKEIMNLTGFSLERCQEIKALACSVAGKLL